MAKSNQALYQIREEVRELRVLYKELIDRLIPVEKPTPEEKKAIMHRGGVASEKELMEALGVHRRD
jgi:hypothetical protein